MTRFADRVAIVPWPTAQQVDPREVARVSAAIQRQVSEHFRPLWKIEATVDFFAHPDDVPSQYARVYILDRLADPRLGGYHKLDAGRPFALVSHDDVLWSVDTSHEVLEVIVDPDGSHLVTGDSPDPELPGRAHFLVEICDPTGRENSAYKVDDVWVSDFHTPLYFDSVAVAGERYSYKNHLKKPKQLIKGGYYKWYDEARGRWYQRDFYGATETTRESDPPDFGQSLREYADAGSIEARLAYQHRNRRKIARMIDGNPSTARAAAQARTARIAREVARLEQRLGVG